jgi:hypothetical protein
MNMESQMPTVLLRHVTELASIALFLCMIFVWSAGIGGV